jgi:hypothetical protein
LGFAYISKVAGNGNQGENTDDDYDNDQLNEGEGFLSLIHYVFILTQAARITTHPPKWGQRLFYCRKRSLSLFCIALDKLGELERKISKHDEDIQDIFEAIRQLMTPPEKSKRRIGFYKT